MKFSKKLRGKGSASRAQELAAGEATLAELMNQQEIGTLTPEGEEQLAARADEEQAYVVAELRVEIAAREAELAALRVELERRAEVPAPTTNRFVTALARKIRGVFRFRYRHKSPRVVQVQC